jgi:hypothetical protein
VAAVALNGRSPLDHIGQLKERFLVQLGIAPLAGSVERAILRYFLTKYWLSLGSLRLEPLVLGRKVATEGTQPKTDWG